MRLKITKDSLYWPSTDGMDERLVAISQGDIVLDLSQIEILTGAALGKLLTLHAKLKSKDRKLVLQNVTPEVREILEVTGLTNILSITSATT